MEDKGRLRDLLDRLTEEVSHLRRLSALPPDELLADPDRLAGVKYRLIVANRALHRHRSAHHFVGGPSHRKRFRRHLRRTRREELSS
jgi:hypothetical protein